MIYVYGIAPEDATIPETLRGVAGADVRTTSIAGLLAFVSEVDEALGADESDLWAHERVVEAIMNGSAVVPARFGTGFPDDESLHAAIAARRPALKDALDRVAGMAEVGMRVIRAETDPNDRPADGRDYLMRKVEAGRRAQHLRSTVEELHEALGERAVDSTARWFVTDHLVLSAAYLIPVAEVEDFKRRAEEASPDEVEVMCTGPWPPYNFVDPRGNR